MSVKVEYKNGHIGTVSDKVGEILERKGEAKIIDLADKPAKAEKADKKGGQK